MAAVWERLALGRFFAERGRHLSFDLGAAIFVMALNRLVDPASKRRVIDWLDDDQALPDRFAPAGKGERTSDARETVCPQITVRDEDLHR